MIINTNINVYNDFDKLNTVILGKPYSKLCNGKYYDEVRKDRENLVNILKQFNIDVIDIPEYNDDKLFYISSPRDNIFTLEHTIIECENRFDYRVGYTEHAKPIFSILSNNKYNVFISMS